MAEAAVEERPPPKFYCHMCNVQFQTASPNFTCPHCSDGFIEELQETPESNNEVEVDDWEDEDVMDLMTTLPLQLMEERRPGRNRPDRPGRRYAVNSRSRNLSRPRTLTRLASSNLRQHVPLETLLQDFIVNLGVGVNWGGGNMQLFLGNPGDYAWGREGLDSIVTQLLNQMDSTGPPPVSKEVIDALPVVEVTDQQVITKLQCSVCWEDFELKENVRQLPCTHIYHEPCIRPWLELHGTCPICRQNLVSDQPPPQSSSSANNQDTVNGSSNNGGNNSFSLLRNFFQSQQSSSDTQSSSGSFDNGGTTRRSRSHSDSMM